MSSTRESARRSLKIVGASGQGVSSTGPLLARGLKRTGYCVFGYREYPSLIQGGHSSYQLDISDGQVGSTERTVDIVVALNHHGLERNVTDLKAGGVLLHVTPAWTFAPEDESFIKEHRIQVVPYPLFDTLDQLAAPPIVGNVLLCSIVWTLLGQDSERLTALIRDVFGAKKDLIQMNLRCVHEGRRYAESELSEVAVCLPDPEPAFADQLLLTGSEAMALGAIHAGVRLFAGYPMTPASFLAKYLSSHERETQMVIKQAEDEMTAAQMVSGAAWMGTRALTATAGVGFDLMTETISMNAMMENPFVIILAQRPGPATGLPTWTGQGGLLTAVAGAHGEFPRCVLAASGSQDSFELVPRAFDIAEKYQIPVILLTDKQIAEALYTQPPFDLDLSELDRHLVTDEDELQALDAGDRYNPAAPEGLSARWLPGRHAATYAAQADEHDATGAVAESSANTRAQIDKRMRKLEHLRANLPQPTLRAAWTQGGPALGAAGRRLDLLLVGWGSTGDVISDVLRAPALAKRRIAYLHYTYLWPLRTELLEAWTDRAARVIIVEQNCQAQLAMLLRMQCGWQPDERILKYDGRPFFFDELLERVLEEIDRSRQPPANRERATTSL